MSSWLAALRRKPLIVLGAGVGLVLVTCVVLEVLAPHRDTWVENIRKQGYPVTLAEFEAWYPSVPPAENAALVYTQAFGLITYSNGVVPNAVGKAWLPPIGQGLAGDQRRQLEAVLAENRAALRLIYSAPDSGRSRYPVRLADWPNTLLPHLGKMKLAVSLLSAEALLHATDGEAEQATRTFLAAGRMIESVTDEPVVISQLVRYADWAILLPSLERALSLATFSDSELASLQRMVGGAEGPRAMARAMAGARASELSFFTDRNMTAMAFRGDTVARNQAGNVLAVAAAGLYRASGLLARDEAFYCDRMGKLLAAWELPYPARFAATQPSAALTNVPNRLYIFSQMLLPALGRTHVRDADHVAFLRIADTALAVERFRLAHTNTLPVTLAQLAPTCCRALPNDPFDGQPLRYKTHGASYAIYSVGSDGQDDGGVAWDTTFLKVPQDAAWVVKH